MSFHAAPNNQLEPNAMQLNNVSCWSDDDDEDMEQNHKPCPLCSFVDESKDGPMAWMRHTYHANVCTTGANELYRMLAQGYRDMFYTPMMQRGIQMPGGRDITGEPDEVGSKPLWARHREARDSVSERHPGSNR